MTDAHEALGQHMQQETPDKLLGCQRHLALLAAVGVVLPAERHPPVVHAEQSVIGDGYAVCVACQVVQHMLRTAERLLDVDYPVVPVQPVEETRESAWLLQPLQGSVKGQLFP